MSWIDAQLKKEGGPWTAACLVKTNDSNARRILEGWERLPTPPELVVEMAPTGGGYDRQKQWEFYKARKVKEVLLLIPSESVCDLFRVSDDGFTPVNPVNDVLHSECFPGLCFKRKELLRNQESDSSAS